MVAGDDANVSPFFPVYSELRHLLRIWPGYPRTSVTGLRKTIKGLCGTRRKRVDWTDPDPSTWIPERLRGGNRKLAQAIWDRSKGAVNPRYTYGHWFLAQRYGLLREHDDGTLQVTKRGRDFLEHPCGATVTAVDEAEGLIKLLSIVANSVPTRRRGLLDEWGEYLSRRTRFGTESTIKDSMRLRLNNLDERGLVEKYGSVSATPDGLAYLKRTGTRR